MIRFKNVIIEYTGVSTGNMDERFSDDALKNQARLFKKINLESQNVVVMQPRNLDSFIDLCLESKEIQHGKFICDAFITENYNQAVTLFPADCIPLVIGCENIPLLSLIHVGRTNIQMDFIEKIIAYILNKYKISAESLFAYIGPSIKKESYVFESINKNQFNIKSWGRFIDKRNGKFQIDLVGNTINRLIMCGLYKKNIKLSSIDTFNNLEYFSHKRNLLNKNKEGRNGFIVYLHK